MHIYCYATLNYTGADDHEPTVVAIRNGRMQAPDPEQANFHLMAHVSAVRDWRDQQEVAGIHGPEVAALAKSLTGCSHALVYDPLIRSPQTAKSHSDYAPIESVHSDFTQDYRRMVTTPEHTYGGFLRPLLAANGLTYDDVIQAQRIAVIQFWRNIGHPRPDRPLAICDASTAPLDHFIPVKVPTYGGQALDFEAGLFRKPDPEDSHHWYIFPEMTRDEVLVFKTYDSGLEEAGRPFYTPHSAFVDPRAGENAPKRESVEMRALCLF